VKFRFEDLEIWRLAIEVADMLYDIADSLEERKLFRFAEQLGGAGISMPHNIAEGISQRVLGASHRRISAIS